LKSCTNAPVRGLISSSQCWLQIARECGTAMCDKCEELDKKIEHYRQLAARVRDPLLTEGVDKLIEEMEAQKTAFHPEQQK
jgi:hypothetical protein